MVNALLHRAPGLWLDDARRAAVRDLLAAGDPTVKALESLAAAVDATTCSPAERVDALVVLHVIHGDAAYAQEAAEALLLHGSDLTAGNLGRADWALRAAVVWDACGLALDGETGARLTAMLIRLGDSFHEADVSHGDPHLVTNNHWAVNHAAALVAALATANGAEASAKVEWAQARLGAYLRLLGEQGFGHEGIGYLAYPSSVWVPAVLALHRRGDVDLAARYPQVRHLALALYATATLDGRRLDWNDDSGTWIDRSTAVTAIALAPPEQAAELRWLFDRLSGHLDDGTFCPRSCGWFFTLACYPFQVAPQRPGSLLHTLPTRLSDQRQGMAIFRSGYDSADDIVVGCYARASSYRANHNHDDAGSLRIVGLGARWVVGGGQARPDAAWQSLVLPAAGRGQKPYGNGYVIWDTPQTLGMDLRHASGAYHERWVAVRFDEGAATVAVLDLVDDHLGRDWHWNLTLGEDLRRTLLASGCELRTADGASLCLRFLGPQPTHIAVEQMPDSSRVYQGGGGPQYYPGLPYLSARFAARPHLAIYAVLVIRRGPPVEPRLVAEHGHGLDLQLGPDDRWRRPFGAALSPHFDLNRGGTTSRWPDGAPANENPHESHAHD